MIRDYEAQRLVLEKIEKHGFGGAVEQIPANKGHIYRAWKDAVHSPTLREALGLAPLYVEIEPCPSCGKVHEQLHTCDEKRQRNKRTKANGWHRRAAWVHEDDLPAFDAWLERNGWASLTEAIDAMIEQEGE